MEKLRRRQFTAEFKTGWPRAIEAAKLVLLQLCAGRQAIGGATEIDSGLGEEISSGRVGYWGAAIASDRRATGVELITPRSTTIEDGARYLNGPRPRRKGRSVLCHRKGDNARESK